MDNVVFINQCWNGKSYETHISCDSSVRRIEVTFDDRENRVKNVVIDRESKPVEVAKYELEGLKFTPIKKE